MYWKCGFCNSYHISNPLIRHEMDVCKCKKSAVDAEEFYIRTMGNVIDISKEEYERETK